MLDTSPNLADPDGFYAALVDAHEGLDDAASRRMDAALVLVLANHIGDSAVLQQAINCARAAVSKMSEVKLHG